MRKTEGTEIVALQTALNFYNSLQAMMEANGDGETGQPFDKPFGEFLRETWPALGDDVQRYQEIGRSIDSQKPEDVKISLKEAVDMKILTDAYFMIKHREKHMPDFWQSGAVAGRRFGRRYMPKSCIFSRSRRFDPA